jgi:tRNA U34 5-carboxymethylaminomethyl modifying enzyme MnmG/GidA
MVRSLIKKAYYRTLNPLYKVVKAEAADEARLISQEHIQRLEQEMEQLKKEVERLKKINLEQQNRIAHQVSEEFVKMYKMIDEIKSDRTDIKLNVTLVDELVKIHQSLEALKYERNGSH